MPLYLIKKFRDEFAFMPSKSQKNPNILTITPTVLTRQYQNMLSMFTSIMSTEYHKPGDNVVLQNSDVVNNGNFLPGTNVYFFLEGVYRRLSLQFDPRHSLTRMLQDEESLNLMIYDDIRGFYKLKTNNSYKSMRRKAFKD